MRAYEWQYAAVTGQMCNLINYQTNERDNLCGNLHAERRAGKTTLTVLVASYLHYVKGYNVAVVDCDFPQYSIHDMRKRDLKAVMEDGHYKVMAYEQLKRLKKNPYTIRCSRAEDAIRTAENLTEAQPDLDFVFFDLPGTINNADVVQTIAKMDYIFTPIIADRVVMESSIKFATVINEQMISTGKSGIKGIYLVWNMVDGREKTELYKAYDKVCAEFALPILETFLPDSKRFRKGNSGGAQGGVPFHGVPCGQDTGTRQQP